MFNYIYCKCKEPINHNDNYCQNCGIAYPASKLPTIIGCFALVVGMCLGLFLSLLGVNIQLSKIFQIAFSIIFSATLVFFLMRTTYPLFEFLFDKIRTELVANDEEPESVTKSIWETVLVAGIILLLLSMLTFFFFSLFMTLIVGGLVSLTPHGVIASITFFISHKIVKLLNSSTLHSRKNESLKERERTAQKELLRCKEQIIKIKKQKPLHKSLEAKIQVLKTDVAKWKIQLLEVQRNRLSNRLRCLNAEQSDLSQEQLETLIFCEKEIKKLLERLSQDKDIMDMPDKTVFIENINKVLTDIESKLENQAQIFKYKYLLETGNHQLNSNFHQQYENDRRRQP